MGEEMKFSYLTLFICGLAAFGVFMAGVITNHELMKMYGSLALILSNLATIGLVVYGLCKDKKEEVSK